MSMTGGLALDPIIVKIIADATKYDQAILKVEQRLMKMADNLVATGTKMSLAITTPLTAFGAVALKQFAAFEEGLTRVKGAANLTQVEFKQMEAAAKSLSRELGMSATKLTGTFGALIRGGMSLDTVIKGGAGKQAAMLAEVGEVGTDVAAETVVKIMSVFKKDGMDAAQSVNILSAAADASVISIGNMIESIAQGSAAAASANIPFKDFAAVMAMVGQKGLLGSDAGTSFKTFVQRLTDPESRMALKALGVDTLDANKNLKDMRTIIDDLNKAFASLPTGEKMEKLSKIFGSDASRIAGMLSDLGAEGFDEMTKGMEEALTVQQKYDQLFATLSGSWSSFTASIERFGIVVGSHLVKPFEVLTGVVNGLLAGFEALPSWLQATLVGLTAIAAAAGPIALGLGAIGKMLAAGGLIATGFGLIKTAGVFAFVALEKAIMSVVTALVAGLIPNWLKLNALLIASDIKNAAGALVAMASNAMKASTSMTALANTIKAAGAAMLAFIAISKTYDALTSPELSEGHKDMLSKYKKALDSGDKAEADKWRRFIENQATTLETGMTQGGVISLPTLKNEGRAATLRAALADLQASHGLSADGSPRKTGNPLAAILGAGTDANTKNMAYMDFADRVDPDKTNWKNVGENMGKGILSRIDDEHAQMQADLAQRGAEAAGRQVEKDIKRFGYEPTEKDIQHWTGMASTIAARLNNDASQVNEERLAKDAVKQQARDVQEASKRLPDALVMGTQQAANAMLKVISAQPTVTGKEMIEKQTLAEAKKQSTLLDKIEKNMQSTMQVEFLNAGG